MSTVSGVSLTLVGWALAQHGLPNIYKGFGYIIPALIHQKGSPVQKKEIKAKQRARQLAVQSLYQWCMTKQPVEEIEAQYLSMNNMEKIDGAYFSELLRGILKNIEEIDHAFTPFLDRPIHELHPTELSVIRIATYELLYAQETPYRIILDESVSLAKLFGAQDGYRYVNGVLNQLAKQVRQIEITSHHD